MSSHKKTLNSLNVNIIEHYSELSDAVLNLDEKRVIKLLKNKVDIHDQRHDVFWETPLVIAIYLVGEKIIELLIDYEIKVYGKLLTLKHLGALYWAIKRKLYT